MSKVFTTTLRFNLDNPEDNKALAYLQARDRKQYRSYSSAVVTAVNDHFSRQQRLDADPFLQEVKDTVREAMQTSGAGLGALSALLQSVAPAQKTDAAMSEESFDTAMDFINGL